MRMRVPLGLLATRPSLSALVRCDNAEATSRLAQSAAFWRHRCARALRRELFIAPLQASIHIAPCARTLALACLLRKARPALPTTHQQPAHSPSPRSLLSASPVGLALTVLLSRLQAFDLARSVTREAAAACQTVVLTAIFGGVDQLRQPLHPPSPKSASCFFAFVDPASAAAALRGRGRDKESGTSAATSAASLPRVGAWRLVVLDGALPFGDARRDSRVPKMLPHRFFPESLYAIWVDGKLQLNVRPEAAVQAYLLAESADVAAVRNLRRESIDHEYAWIASWMCKQSNADGGGGGGGAARAAGARGGAGAAADEACAALRRQMMVYRHEQSHSAGWEANTAVIEGALLLLDLRSAATHCLLCAWFNEYVRFGERDQLSFSYVLHVQRPAARVHLLPRRLHWSVTVEDDTTACYNATEDDASALAVRFQHGHAGARPRPRPKPRLAQA